MTLKFNALTEEIRSRRSLMCNKKNMKLISTLVDIEAFSHSSIDYEFVHAGA